MSSTQLAIGIVCLVLLDLVIVAVVLRSVGRTVRSLAAKYPPQPVGPGAVRREFQSFRFHLLKLGGCVHVDVDDRFLHLSPAWFARVFVNMRPMSVPWGAIVVDPSAKISRRWQRAARVDQVDLLAPAWVIDLAEGRTTDEPTSAATNSATTE